MQEEKRDKMIVHYIWMENYGCYHNFGCNLSSKYKFAYYSKEENIVLENKSNDYVDDFFGNNMDATAIIGNNGAGKTTLLRFLFNITHGLLNNVNYVIVFERINNDNESHLFAWKHDEKNNVSDYKQINIHGYDDKGYEVGKYIEIKDTDFGKEVRSIYLTELYDMDGYMNSFGGEDDLSFASLLHKQAVEGDEEKHIGDHILKYNHRIIDWQINFLAHENVKTFSKFFKFRYPELLYIKFSYDTEEFSRFYVNVKIDEFIEKKKLYAKPNVDIEKEFKDEIDEKKREYDIESRNYFNEINREKGMNAKAECAKAILFNVLSSRKYFLDRDKDEDKILFNIIDEVRRTSKETDALWNKVIKILEKTQNYHFPIKDQRRVGHISVNAERYISFMHKYSEYLDNRIIDYNPIYNDMTIKSYGEVNKNDIQIKDIQSFFEAYKNCISFVEFLSFSWGLSSGEMMLLNLFSKLTHLLNFENEKAFLPNKINNVVLDPEKPVSNAIILLDEAEVAYHPEWQRLYFQSVLNFLQKNISSKTHVQLIIATHSPIILSDVPKQNTVFIKTDISTGNTVSVESEETFAANVYSLFKNSFFLDQCMLGAFAEKKLKELAVDIRAIDEKTECEKIEQRINLIGDEFIRRKFWDMYNQKRGAFYCLESLEARIKQLEAQVDQLEKVQNEQEADE